jgi:hypothetical protein
VLQEFGFREGDRLALALPNRSEFFEAGFAAAAWTSTRPRAKQCCSVILRSPTAR